MKTSSLLLTALLIASNSAFSMPEAFSCERIKEKPVREACIKDRNEKARSEQEAQSKAALAEQERQAERANAQKEAEAKSKLQDEFVGKSKQLIVQNLKDPDSAKFTNLVIAQNETAKLLCGSINAKNSYGGYVGAKRFYVLWENSSPEKPEAYTEGDEMERANARLDELKAHVRSAGPSHAFDALQESNRVVAQARKDHDRSSKILAEQCTGPSIIPLTTEK